MSAESQNRMLFVMVDGLADVSIPKYNGLTTLQKANTPTMDLMIIIAFKLEYGVNGIMDPVEPGYACGSDTAHLSIFGYDPRIGRGAFEAMGAGLDMVPGDIAFKSNFATIDTKTGIVTSRRADRNFEHLGPILCDYLTGVEYSKLPSFPDYRVDVKYATEHRCGIRVRGPGLTDAITNTDPLKDNLPLLRAQSLDGSKEAEFTARLVNELSDVIRAALEKHPINAERAKEGLALANVVLLRGCGVRAEAPTFFEKYKMRAFMIAPTCIIAGLGMSIEIDLVEAPGGTGDYHTDFDSKARTAAAAIKSGKYDFGFLHIKAVDDAGHDKDADLKVRLLEKVDAMLAKIVDELGQAELEGVAKFSICVTGDHSTPVLSGDHSCEPVPFTISKPLLMKQPQSHENWKFIDKVQQFSEIDCSSGALGRFPGSQIMNIITQYMNTKL
ncbi:hypothetical protein PPL_06454 [Heterostelium album PN500]|uniref:Metalloenzyme domain-containing protein n=1 Tax=Heterostelium pallidum (strain ATCC 26659 / Pp 5 / PN500) TaxID=670386 RepID=D3BD73_HETP5|nr:hypothetical protein PPL_06454 [Heterostelium album PN500]EFA80865.1 hypothetical protein PPL_06454 [Heterostelium album PN500]|eukprot:XP_020432984.1 hypothetical protein PPL_06454 [Heterostelium album PN500]